jgi:O-antigen/teichoic acid export membrane protein
MNTVQTIAKNTRVLGIVQVRTSMLGFFLLICITEYLCEIGFGRYSFVLSFTSSFMIFTGIEINNYRMRMIVRSEEPPNERLANISLIKFLLSSPKFLTVLYKRL